MSNQQEPFRIVVLDDYQNVALSLADWSVLDVLAEHSFAPAPSDRRMNRASLV
jgi:hypothetical protein